MPDGLAYVTKKKGPPPLFWHNRAKKGKPAPNFRRPAPLLARRSPKDCGSRPKKRKTCPSFAGR